MFSEYAFIKNVGYVLTSQLRCQIWTPQAGEGRNCLGVPNNPLYKDRALLDGSTEADNNEDNHHNNPVQYPSPSTTCRSSSQLLMAQS